MYEQAAVRCQRNFDLHSDCELCESTASDKFRKRTKCRASKGYSIAQCLFPGEQSQDLYPPIRGSLVLGV